MSKVSKKDDTTRAKSVLNIQKPNLKDVPLINLVFLLMTFEMCHMC